MVNNFSRALGSILTKNVQKEVVRTPRKPTVAPPPPVLSPVAQAAATVASHVPQAAPRQTVAPPPPTLSLSAALASNVAREIAPKPIYTMGTGSGVSKPNYSSKNPLAGAVAMPQAREAAEKFKAGAEALKARGQEFVDPQRAKQMEDFATSSLSGAMKNAATVMSPQWQEDNRFLLVKDNADGTNRLVDRDKMGFDYDHERFNVLSNVSTDEAKSIAATQGVEDDRSIGTMGSGDVDSTQAGTVDEMGIQDSEKVRQRLDTRKEAEDIGLVMIDGRYLPAGSTEAPDAGGSAWHSLPKWIRTAGSSVWDADSVTSTEDLPPAPEGWIWVARDGKAELIKPEIGEDGSQSVPDGYTKIGGDSSKWEALDPVAKVVNQGVGAAVAGGANLVDSRWEALPDNWEKWFEDNYDEHIQEPLQSAIDNLPEGRLRDGLTQIIENPNPITAAITMASLPQQGNIDNITQAVLYPGETGWDWAAFPYKNMPVVSSYTSWMEDNKEQAQGYYENGYDSDGDGEPDMFAGEAVTEAWRVEANVGEAEFFLFQVITDPLTAVAGVGAGGKMLSRAGRTARLAPEAGLVTRVLGRGAEITGNVLERGARYAEDVSDLGVQHLLNKAGTQAGKVNTPVSSARMSSHVASAKEAINRLRNQRTGSVGSIGTITPDGIGGGKVKFELSDANAPTTGPLASVERSAPTTSATDLARLYDDAYALEPGDSIPTPLGAATKTDAGLSVDTPTGQRVFNSTAEITHAVETMPTSSGVVPVRWEQWPLGATQANRYIDRQPKGLYETVRNEIGIDNLESSVAYQRTVDTPGSDIANISHLKESDRMAWEWLDATERVDPTYSRGKWDRNTNGGDTQYQLAEVFHRADNATAVKYFQAMTGDGSTVPLFRGIGYRGTSPLFSLERIPAKIRHAGNSAVIRANQTVDLIYSRLRWDKYDGRVSLSDPQMSMIVEQAAELDYDLRKRGLRTNTPGHDYPPITTVIPDGSAIRLRPEVKSMGGYTGLAPSSVTDGEYLGTVTISADGTVAADIYLVMLDTVPANWQALFPEADQITWTRADTVMQDGAEFSVYAPDDATAIQMSMETAASRGVGIDPEEGITPHDHLSDVEPPQEFVEADTDSLPAPEPIAAPEGDRGVTEAQARRERRAKALHGKTTFSPDTPQPALPEPVGTIPDPTGTLDLPNYPKPESPPPPTGNVASTLPHITDNQLKVNTVKMKRLFRKNRAEVWKQPKYKAMGDDTYVARTGLAEMSNGDRYWLGRTIEDFQIDALTTHPFADGETLMDRISRYFAEEVEATGGVGGMEDYLDAAIKKAWPEYEALLVEKYPKGVLPNWAKAGISKLPQPIQQILAYANTAIRTVFLKPFDKYSSWKRERILFSRLKALHYPMTQYLGNAFVSVMAGDPVSTVKMFDPRTSISVYKALEKADPEMWWRETGIPTPSQEMFTKLGLARAPELTEVFEGRGIGDASTTKLNKILNSPFAKKAGGAGDVAYRDAVESTLTMRNIKEIYPDYRNMEINRLVDWLKIDKAAATAMWREFEQGRKSWEFSYNDIIDHFSTRLGNGDAVLGRGRAERIGRDWQQSLNKTQKKTRSELRYRTMAQPETKLDLIARRGMAFPFFQVRQMWFMYNQLARHPFLINMYMNAQDALEELSEDWPPYMQGFVRIMGLPSGRHLFLNPVALLSTYTLFEQQNVLNEEYDTRGGFRKWFDSTFGIDPYDLASPVVSDVTNVLGLRGDIWAPDLLGIGREATVVNLIINTGRAYGLLGDDPTPIGDIYKDWSSKFREFVSTGAEAVGLPGAKEVEARSNEQSIDREITAIMIDEAEKDGLDLTNPDDYAIFLEAQLDPNSDLYKRSVKRWLMGEWEEQAAKVVIGPLRPRTLVENKDGGALMFDLSKEAKSLVNTPEPMVGAFKRQANGYYAIGTQREQGLSSVYNEIIYGEVVGDITIDGHTYTEEEVNAMTYDQRVAIADGMMAELGVADDLAGYRDEQDKYLAQPENAEYAQYRTWSSEVRKYDGGPEQYWIDLARDNPTAAAYYEDVIQQETDPDVRSRLMTNQSAYFGIVGWDSNAFDKPMEEYDSRAEVWDPLGILNTQPQPIPYEEPNADFRNEVRETPVYMSEMEAYDTAFRDKMEQRGYPRDASIAALPAKQRTAIEKELEEEGTYEPKPSTGTKKYLEWVADQPEGSDISMEAFIEFNDAEYYEGLPGKTHDKVNTAPPVEGPDKYGNTPANAASTENDKFWEELYSLINQHDHTRYKDPITRP